MDGGTRILFAGWPTVALGPVRTFVKSWVFSFLTALTNATDANRARVIAKFDLVLLVKEICDQEKGALAVTALWNICCEYGLNLFLRLEHMTNILQSQPRTQQVATSYFSELSSYSN